MNSRKTTKIVETITRQLKGSYLKLPPPSYFPILSHPPQPSLVRFLSPRPNSDLPPSIIIKSTTSTTGTTSTIKNKKLLNKLKKTKGTTLTNQERYFLRSPLANSDNTIQTITTRRPPPRTANSKNNKPQPIVFPEDQIRLQFFRDHPFEAFKPIDLVESEFIRDYEGPQGKDWTELSQRSKIPTAEDCIQFTHHLNSTFSLPLSQAYSTSLHQFHLLRSSHENSLRSATSEAKAHGAIFFGEIERGLRVEERVLDGWKEGRDVQREILARRPGSSSIGVGTGGGGGGVDLSFLGGEGRDLQVEGMERDLVEFTGGVNYVERFNQLMNSLDEEEGEGVEVRVEGVQEEKKKEEEIGV